MYNASVRCLALWKIDFDQVAYQAEYLEHSTMEPIENVEVYWKRSAGIAMLQNGYNVKCILQNCTKHIFLRVMLVYVKKKQ